MCSRVDLKKLCQAPLWKYVAHTCHVVNRLRVMVALFVRDGYVFPIGVCYLVLLILIGNRIGQVGDHLFL